MMSSAKLFERLGRRSTYRGASGASSNAVHPHAPVFYPRMPARDRCTPSVIAPRGASVLIVSLALDRRDAGCTFSHTAVDRARLDHRSVAVKLVSPNTGDPRNDAAFPRRSAPARGDERFLAVLRRRHPRPALERLVNPIGVGEAEEERDLADRELVTAEVEHRLGPPYVVDQQIGKASCRERV